MRTRNFTTQCSNSLVVQSGGDGGDLRRIAATFLLSRSDSLKSYKVKTAGTAHFVTHLAFEPVSRVADSEGLSGETLQLCFVLNENRNTSRPNPAKIAAATKPVVEISARD